MKSIITFATFLLQSLNICSSFIIQPSIFSRGSIYTTQQVRVITVEEPFSSTALSAKKKKRRRRKDSSPSSSSSPTENVNELTPSSSTVDISIEDNDELPDFDLFEDEMDDTTTSTSSSSSSNTMKSTNTIQSNKNKDIDLNDPTVLAAMKATKGSEAFVGSSGGSTKDLLRNRNRELEQKLVLDEITEDVPSLAEYNAKKGGASNAAAAPKMGRKALRREQAIAAAQEAERQKMEEENGIFSKLPFISGGNSDGTEEKEEKSIIKVCTCVTFSFFVCDEYFLFLVVVCLRHVL